VELGLYVVTAAGMVPGRTHLDVGLAAVEGGANVVQLRARGDLSAGALQETARRLAEACAAAGVVFVVNDDVETARMVGAGLHVGQDADARLARRLLGGGAVIGVSVATREEARKAADAGADYVAVTVWATPTKPEAVPYGLEGVRDIAAGTSVPVVGIGGIDASNASVVLAAGAAGIAVISAVAAAGDPVAATQELAEVVRTFRGGATPAGR